MQFIFRSLISCQSRLPLCRASPRLCCPAAALRCAPLSWNCSPPARGMGLWELRFLTAPESGLGARSWAWGRGCKNGKDVPCPSRWPEPDGEGDPETDRASRRQGDPQWGGGCGAGRAAGAVVSRAGRDGFSCQLCAGLVWVPPLPTCHPVPAPQLGSLSSPAAVCEPLC